MAKMKKGFKSDRLAAKRDPARRRKEKAMKTGKATVSSAHMKPGKKAESGGIGGGDKGEKKARPKAINLDTKSLKEYVTGFHKRKMQRKLYGRKRAREAHRAAVNTERRERRERRRQLFNQVTQFPMDENFKICLPDEESDYDDDDGDGPVSAEPTAHNEVYEGAEESTVEVCTEPLALATSVLAPPVRQGRRRVREESASESEEAPPPPRRRRRQAAAADLGFPETDPVPGAKLRLVRRR
eukprot:TRINITY_DN30432_c0_g1_i1.p1 TRINITY_DN30432_c0_g1~~TRINITY_DN30432_c0_g1_i1.p1  ORF type:complete len:241 (+),score=68.47 TRINITY_DN30432_c0_g1_i1:62-784(+)